MNCCKVNKDVALLVGRIIIGALLALAGWMKVSDIASTIGFFAQIGFPAFLAYFVAYAELIAGIFVVLGLWTRKSSMLLAIIMIVAVWVTRAGGPQMFGYPLALFAGFLILSAVGSGKFAVKPCSCCEAGNGATCGVSNS